MKNIIFHCGKKVKLPNTVIDNLSKLWMNYYIKHKYLLSFYHWINIDNDFGIKLIQTNPFKRIAYYEITDKELFALSRIRYGF
jgi:hypothetical protein